MDQLLWNRIGELLAEARELSDAKRIAFLKERCGDDGELLRQVMSLLEVGSKSGLLDSKPTISAFPVPEIVAGRFRIIRYIAEGGMGTVYEAEDLTLGDRVALKTIRPDIASRPHAVERFKREISLGKKVTHPNVCRIYDLGVDRTEDGRDFLFLTMQFLSGETLSSRIKRGPIPTNEALPLIEDMTAALAAAHQASVIHRDFKSSNVMLIKGAARVCAVVTDFGLAKQLHEELPLSQTGMVGTVSYMAPEQIRGEELTSATDIYALGVVLYEMVTGELPFKGDSNVAIALKHLNDEPKPPRELIPNLEPRWQKAILGCLRKLPAERFQSAEEVREALVGDAAYGSVGKRTARNAAAAARARQKWRERTLVAIILLTVLVSAWYVTHRSKFHEKDTIVLADFDDQTGESGWDPTLKLVLTNDLEDSQYLNVLPDQTVSETLKMMKHQPDERLTKDLAKQVCLRNGNKAMLTASIAKIGERYHLAMRATNCVTGITLASSDADADSKEKVIPALKEASNELRQKLGESLVSVQKYSTRLPEATTGSLDAIQAYALGVKVKAAQGSLAAVPFYKRAIELDPEFADAYAALGAAYSDLGENSLWIENSRKAYELRDHVSSQRERFHIEGDYYDSAGEVERGNQTYLNWIQVYPDDHRPHQNLGANYCGMGQYDKAVEEEETVLQLKPNNVNAFTGLMGDYLSLDQLEKAKDVFEEARKQKLDNNILELYRYYTAFLENDGQTMQKQLTWAMGRPGAEDALLSAESDTEAFYGRFDRARSLTKRAVQSAKNADMAETAAGWMANAAMREAEAGNKVQARAIAADALEMSRGRDVELQIALALAKAGQLLQAEKIAAKLDAEYPRGTMVQNYWLPTIRAAIELQKNNANKAIELLEETVPYELGEGLQGHMYPAYLRGEAYLQLGRGQEAAAEFQKVLDHRGIVVNFVIGSLARLQLARAAAKSGDTASARKHYADFLELWKNADANLPVFTTAETEYKRLN